MEKLIHIYSGDAALEGMLVVPENAKGVVLFAHGSGSSRLSPRNNFVASVLNKAGLATLLIDLLSREEDAIYQTRFDIDLLTERLIDCVKWLQNNQGTQALLIGLFGASTGAAAALAVAAAVKKSIKAVVSRGGRPDLVLPLLGEVVAPTLLIVGGSDDVVIELNEEAFAALTCEKRLDVIPGATHLFEEPGCLEEVARKAREWFLDHFGKDVSSCKRH